jgi:hypothetical protein
MIEARVTKKGNPLIGDSLFVIVLIKNYGLEIDTVIKPFLLGLHKWF